MSAPPGMTALESGTHEGIEWATVRAPMFGAVNGYVRVPEGHPWHGLGYDDVPVEVHGGLTYGSRDGWIGFDTLHAGDVWPGSPDYDRELSWSRDWTPGDVVEEVLRLAEQVAGARRTEEPAASAWRKALR